MTRFEGASVGFYGKVRTHGDFVGRRLPSEFVARWDTWLQRGLLKARERLGDDWLNEFLGMPIWCFAMKPGVIDEAAYAGMLMPGIDAVGRYFPFMIGRSTKGADLDNWLCGSARWYEQAAELALSTLKARFSLTEFEAGLDELDVGASSPGWQDTFKRFLHEGDGTSVWWTVSGEHAPSALHWHEGALDAALFLHLLDAG
jgi:type VI secretion system protein ImpM